MAPHYNNGGPHLDLTLKLGLPDQADNNGGNTNTFSPPPMASPPNNFFFNPRAYQGLRDYRLAGGHEWMTGQAANPGLGNNFPVNHDGRIDRYGRLNHFYGIGNYHYPQNMMMNPMNGGAPSHFNMINHGAPPMAAANFNPSAYNTSTVAFPPPPITNEYTLIDTPARRSRNVDPFDEDSAGRGGRRQRTGSYSAEPNKRCSNFNCGTTETPMWRRGPLGPKTLCNACGIKYRKEEEKRRAKEASRSSG